MDVALDRVFGKTERGREALESRALTGKLRTALILVNGRDSVAALRNKLGPNAAPLIGQLMRAGLVEVCGVAPEPVRASPQPAPRPVPGSTPLPIPPTTVVPVPAPTSVAAATPESGDATLRLRVLQREAVERLAPHFGPDVMLIAKPLLEAGSLKAFADALTGIEQRLAIYMGKSAAGRVVAAMRP